VRIRVNARLQPHFPTHATTARHPCTDVLYSTDVEGDFLPSFTDVPSGSCDNSAKSSWPVCTTRSRLNFEVICTKNTLCNTRQTVKNYIIKTIAKSFNATPSKT
jgi:hypothetical protein